MKVRTWLRRAAITVAALGVLAGLVALGVVAYGHWRLKAELERIRAEGYPVTLAEIELPPGAPSDLSWLDFEDPIGPEWLWAEEWTMFAFEDMLVRAAESEAHVGVAAALKRVDECRSERGWTELWTGIGDKLHLRAVGDWTLDACERDAVRANALSFQKVRDRFPRPAEFSPPYERFDAGVSGPTLGTPIGMYLAKAYPLAAIDHALEGHPEEAVSSLVKAFRASAWWRPAPGTLLLSVRQITLGMPLHAVEVVVSRVPHDADLGTLEEQLESIDARGELLSALIGERALGGTVFEEHLFESEAPSWLLRSLFAYDRLVQLEYVDLAIEMASLPLPEALRNARTEWPEPPPWALVSLLVVPDYPGNFEGAARTAARVRLARGLLLAHAQGLDAALEWAAAEQDPFTGEPLRARVRHDGVLEMWSVGPNLRDDDGVVGEEPYEDPPDDICVRFKALR